MDQTRGEAKKSRDSRGWRLVWPVNSLAQTPDESAKARAVAVEAAADATRTQRSTEASNVDDITRSHNESADDAAAQKLNTR